VAKRRTLTLRWEQRQELEEARAHDRRPSVRERCAAVLKIADGQTAHAVARQGLLKGRDPDTVYAWLEHYQGEGMAGVVGHTHGGSHRRRLRAGPAAHTRASG
jgi:Winged helix-turn helix